MSDTTPGENASTTPNEHSPGISAFTRWTRTCGRSFHPQRSVGHAASITHFRHFTPRVDLSLEANTPPRYVFQYNSIIGARFGEFQSIRIIFSEIGLKRVRLNACTETHRKSLMYFEPTTPPIRSVSEQDHIGM